jgi:hypothetical protein
MPASEEMTEQDDPACPANCAIRRTRPAILRTMVSEETRNWREMAPR